MDSIIPYGISIWNPHGKRKLPKKEIGRAFSLDPEYEKIMLTAAFLVEKIAKYKKKHNSKIDLAYGKISQKGNNVWNDSIYSYNPKYV